MNQISIRSAPVASYDKSARSVRATLATAEPVFCWTERGPMNEVLLAEGADFPEKVSFLDSHSRDSVKTIIGSVRDFHRLPGRIDGAIHFADTSDGKHAESLARDGHLGTVSVGYQTFPAESDYIADGERASYSGREYSGPVLIRKKWKLREVSAVSVPADDGAQIRGEIMQNQNQAAEATTTTAGGTPNAEEAVLAERERVADIAAMCARYKFPDLAHRLIRDGAAMDVARQTVLSAISAREQAEGSPRTMSLEEIYYGDGARSAPYGGQENLRKSAAVDGLTLRAGIALEPDEIARGADEYRHLSLVEVAADCLSGNMVSTRGLSPTKIAQRAMMTSDFPHLLGAVGDRILTKEFRNQSGTWRPISNMMPAADFRERTAVDLHDLSGLHETAEGAPYLYGGFSDKKAAVYSVVKHGRIYSMSLEAIVNDQLDGFGRMFRHFGQLAGGLVNRSVLGILSGNPLMQDGVTLFHADHSNLASVNVGPPSEAAISEGLTGIARQPDIEGHPLGLRGRYILVPPETEVTARKVVYSDASSASGGNSGIRNPLAGMGLDVLSDAALTDSNEWYIVANPQQTDTIHAAFLDGVDRPTVTQREGFEIDGLEYKVRIIFGCAAVSYRAFWKNAGA